MSWKFYQSIGMLLTMTRKLSIGIILSIRYKDERNDFLAPTEAQELLMGVCFFLSFFLSVRHTPKSVQVRIVIWSLPH